MLNLQDYNKYKHHNNYSLFSKSFIPSKEIEIKKEIIYVYTDQYIPSNKEYEIKQNFFNPSKNSPPNEFMKKLYERSNIYSRISNNNDNFDIV
jgi:hypothetical protein